MKNVSPTRVLNAAALLVTDDDSNPEYDRAITELVRDLLGIDIEHHDSTLDFLRAIAPA